MNRRGFLAALAGLPFVGKLFPQDQSFEAKYRPWPKFHPDPNCEWPKFNGDDAKLPECRHNTDKPSAYRFHEFECSNDGCSVQSIGDGTMRSVDFNQMCHGCQRNTLDPTTIDRHLFKLKCKRCGIEAGGTPAFRSGFKYVRRTPLPKVQWRSLREQGD